MKKIWAVGNREGLAGYFAPYETQNGLSGEQPISTTTSGIPNSNIQDELTASTNVDTFDSPNEQKALNNGWTSGSTPIVKEGQQISPTPAP